MATETKSKPWYHSLTIIAALATVAQGTLYEMTQVLDPYLPPWLKALLMAITTGLAIFGRIQATAAIGKPKTPPAAMLLLLVALPLLGGCAMTPAARLQTVATSVNALHASAAPAWSSVCKGKAEKCVTDGVQASKDCGPWVACQDALKRYYEAHLALQRGIQTAAWHLINDNEPAAARVLATVTAGLATAYELARAEGAIQ